MDDFPCGTCSRHCGISRQVTCTCMVSYAVQLQAHPHLYRWNLIINVWPPLIWNVALQSFSSMTMLFWEIKLVFWRLCQTVEWFSWTLCFVQGDSLGGGHLNSGASCSATQSCSLLHEHPLASYISVLPYYSVFHLLDWFLLRYVQHLFHHFHLYLWCCSHLDGRDLQFSTWSVGWVNGAALAIKNKVEDDGGVLEAFGVLASHRLLFDGFMICLVFD